MDARVNVMYGVAGVIIIPSFATTGLRLETVRVPDTGAKKISDTLLGSDWTICSELVVKGTMDCVPAVARPMRISSIHMIGVL